jgi:beta-lactamase regulating signal transducer with metallopeptidase domain
MLGSRLWEIAGWTMLHYFWVGAALGVAAICVRRALRTGSANVRYAAASGSLFLLAVAPLVIAAVMAQNIASPVADAPASNNHASRHNEMPTEGMQIGDRGPSMAASVAPPSAVGVDSSNVAPVAESREPLLSVFDPLAVWLPWLWVIGAPLSFMLTTAGLLGAERLRRQSRPLADDRITEMCRQLAAALKMSRRVSVGICDRIAAPILVGVLRPMILLPAVALAGWSPEQLEMVLLHELAHVRRFDNLVNLVQRIVESALFFHPMVWIVSGWVRREREHCCDELVVARTRRPREYAEVLVTLAERIPPRSRRGSLLPHPQAVSSLVERPLVVRIRRILRKEQETMQVSRKAVGLALAGVLTLAVTISGYCSLPGYAEESPPPSKESPSLATAAEKPAASDAPATGKTGRRVRPLAPAGTKPATGKNYVVVPFTSQLQRALRRSYQTATFFVLINAAPMINKDDTVLDIGAVDFKGLSDAMQAYIKADLLDRVIVEADVGTRDVKCQPGNASWVLLSFLESVPPTDDRSTSLCHRDTDYNNWTSLAAKLGTPPTDAEVQREAGVGDDLVHVYPICTPLARLLSTHDADCVIRNVKPFDKLTPEEIRPFASRAQACAVKLGLKLPAKAFLVFNGGTSLTKSNRVQSALRMGGGPGDSDWWKKHGFDLRGEGLWNDVQFTAPSLLVKVTVQDGRALKGVKVTVDLPPELKHLHPTITPSEQNDGRWRCSFLPRDDEFTLTVAAPGFQPSSQKLTLPEGAKKEVTVKLKPAATKANGASDNKSAESHECDETKGNYTSPISLSGLATDLQGKPIRGAKIYIGEPRVQCKRLAETTTDEQGRYAFHDVQLPIERADPGHHRDQGCFEVFGQAPGYGVAWRPLKWYCPQRNGDTYFPGSDADLPVRYMADDKIELDLKFPPPATLRGRIVDDAGKPIANTTLAIRLCEPVPADGYSEAQPFMRVWSAREFESLNEPAIVPPEIKVRKTDANGQFEFTGLHPDCRYSIDVRPPGFAGRSIMAATCPPADKRLNGYKVYPNELALTFVRPRDVPIVVLYGDTRKPAGKVFVDAFDKNASVWKVSDAKGQATLRLPPGDYNFSLLPAFGTPYLLTDSRLKVPDSSTIKPVVVTLRPAAEVEVRVLDADTGRGLAGVDLWSETSVGSPAQPYRDVHSFRSYEVATNICHVESPRTNADGTLRALFEPGKHRIGVALRSFPEGYESVEGDGVEIDAKPGEPLHVTFHLRKGTTSM